MKFFNVFIAVLCIGISLPQKMMSQSFAWASAFLSTDHVNIHSVMPDASGNVYATGSYEIDTDFDPGPFVQSLPSAGGTSDIFIIKLDESGNMIWVRTFGSSQDQLERGLALLVDDSGNVYVAGMFGGNIDFNQGPETAVLYCEGGRDGYILKLDSEGNFLWVRRIGGSESDQVNGLAFDTSENVYATGTCGPTTNFDSVTGPQTVVSSFQYNGFVCKYDPQGNLVWTSNYGGPGTINPWTIDLDGSGNIFTAGNFGGTIDFDPGESELAFTSAGFDDVFINKLDNEGNLLWAKQIGGVENDFGDELIADEEGNVYFTGNFKETVDMDPGSGEQIITANGGSDACLSKFDGEGNLLWVNRYGSTGNDEGRSIALDVNGGVYAAGIFNGTVDFDSGSNELNVTSAGMTDVYITRLNADGQLAWLQTFGGTSGDRTRNIFVNADGTTVYVSSEFDSDCDFDPGESDYIVEGEGGCVLKLSQSGNSIPDQSNRLQIFPYPNPTKGPIAVDLKETYSHVSLTVWNQWGQEIMRENFKGIHRAQITIPGTVGLYQVELKTEKGDHFFFRVMKD